MTVSRRIPPRKRKRGGLRFLFAFTTTTAMIATGGFGTFPDNPLTEAFQEVISENVPADFLNPFNSYMESLSAPTIQPQPASALENESPPDLLGFFQDLFAENTSEQTPIPSEAAVIETAMASIKETQTKLATVTVEASSPTVTQVFTQTRTQTSVPTLTMLPTATESLTPISTVPPAIVYPTSTSTKKPLPNNTYTPTVTPTFTPSPPCSISSSTAANVTFTNSSSTETVNIYWVDYACNLTLYATLAPGQSLGVGTYLTHAWRFTNASTGQLIGDHVVSAPGTVDIWLGTVSISGDFSVSSVSLNGGGSSIVVAPGQIVNVIYNFNVWDDPCPGCITQLVTGLGIGGTHGGSCAFDGDAALYPGTSGSENVNLTAPLSPGITSVTVQYQWQFSCADALTAYTGGTTIGQVDVTCAAAGPANISGELWYYGNTYCSCNEVCAAHGGINTTAFDKVGGITGTNAYCDLVFDTLLGPGTVVDWAGIGNGLGCMYDIAGFRVRYIDAVDPAASSGNVQRICACNN